MGTPYISGAESVLLGSTGDSALLFGCLSRSFWVPSLLAMLSISSTRWSAVSDSTQCGRVASEAVFLSGIRSMSTAGGGVSVTDR
jgi:hypothetical protein